MVDITHKSNTLRYAKARAVLLVSKAGTIELIEQDKVPKGNVFEVARAAGLLAVKHTHLSIPDCHPLPIEYAAVHYEVKDLEIIVTVEVKTIYKTGVEVEAMHGAGIVALTLYDMLKPVDPKIEIRSIRLLAKKGGKSSYPVNMKRPAELAIVVCSDSIAAGKKEDRAGRAIAEKLAEYGIREKYYKIIPDEKEAIEEEMEYLRQLAPDLLIFTGGTGLSPRDITPESIRPYLDREIPGIEEAIRSYGQDRTPYAMLSRSVAGLMDNTLVLAIPGSSKGAAESIEAIFPAVLHIFKVLDTRFKH